MNQPPTPPVARARSRRFRLRVGVGIVAISAAALGGSLAVVLSTLWLTSAFWYFTNVRFGF